MAFRRTGAGDILTTAKAKCSAATAATVAASKLGMETGQVLASPLGRITIASGAIAQIVAETALECYGVVGMKGSLRGRMARGKAHARGIEVGRDPDGGVTVDLHVVVEYGLNLAEVASSVRNRVAYEVERLTALPVLAVEVHVDAVRASTK